MQRTTFKMPKVDFDDNYEKYIKFEKQIICFETNLLNDTFFKSEV